MIIKHMVICSPFFSSDRVMQELIHLFGIWQVLIHPDKKPSLLSVPHRRSEGVTQ